MHADDLLNSNYVKWMLAEEAPASDIVISSRTRLARNLNLIPFPHLLDQKSGERSLAEIQAAWQKSQDPILREMELLTFDQLSPLDRQILVEKHLISPNHAAANEHYRGLLVNRDGALAIMINEEDHLRIQCLLPGLQVEACYEMAERIDDQLEKNLNFAFDESRGYLTACPTNVGTGMRASVMLHLPAITLTGLANAIFQNIAQLGMTVRGLYGEGSEVVGNLYQVSNQVTLGQSEEDIINNLTTITAQMVDQERIMRSRLANETRFQLEDRVGRAFGILTNARIMTSNEALNLLSDVRLGVDLGIIKDIRPFALNELMAAVSPAHLQKRSGQEMDPFQRDVKRAEVIKEKLG